MINPEHILFLLLAILRVRFLKFGLEKHLVKMFAKCMEVEI